MLAPSTAISSPRVTARWLAAILVGIALFVAVWPAVALGHELLVLAVAAGLVQIETSPSIQSVIRLLPSDPVYTRAVVSLVSDIQGAGVATAGPIGSLLHATWPSLFLPPELVSDGAWTSALILPGSTVMARGLSFLAADVILLALAWATWRWALTGAPTTNRRGIALVAGAVQVHVLVSHLINARISLSDVEALGLPFAFSALFSGSPHDRPRLTTLLLQLPDSAQTAVLGLLLAIVAFAVAAAHVELLGRATRFGIRRWKQPVLPPYLARTRPSGADSWALAICALMLGLSPISTVADAETRVLSVSAEPVVFVEPPTPIVAEEARRDDSGTEMIAGPATVTVSGNDFRYTYLVDGSPVRIQGMGYNVRYAQLPMEDRVAAYDRDFALMRDAGVNTVFGWETAEFDRVTLDRAWAFGLGVAPPFDLRPELDYTDPDIRAGLRAEVLAWVTEYKDHPAVRMWAVGNEVLHKLVFPSWMSVQADEWREARAEAFAAFLVELVDEIHELDPNHPVIHRDAEDAYVRHVREAFTRDGVDRDWFMYGVNVYTPRISAVLDNWPELGLDVPLFVSEFAPGGLGAQDRPTGLLEMWDVIQDAGDRVIGGAVYAWAVDGPEEVDRVFGLVDESGLAVDGALNAVTHMYGGQPPAQTERLAPRRDEVARVRDHVRLAITSAQETGVWPEGFGGSTRAVARILDEIGNEPVRDEDFQAARLTGPAREVSDDTTDEVRDWWVTWSPWDEPGARISFLVEEDEQAGLKVTFACRASA